MGSDAIEFTQHDVKCMEHLLELFEPKEPEPEQSFEFSFKVTLDNDLPDDKWIIVAGKNAYKRFERLNKSNENPDS